MNDNDPFMNWLTDELVDFWHSKPEVLLDDHAKALAAKLINRSPLHEAMQLIHELSLDDSSESVAYVVLRTRSTGKPLAIRVEEFLYKHQFKEETCE